MKPKFETREELLQWIRTKTGGGLQHAQAILEFVEQNSLTLRDEFAARAMAAILAKFSYEDMKRVTPDELREGTAQGAYKLADAMLAERAK